jgi:hypothetical protein
MRPPGSFFETTGQRLLQEGSSKFSATLSQCNPGVLFIDEVYQLNPKENIEGKAITNMIMEATENYRHQMTVVVAGYANDVRDKWLSYNPGLISRFPLEVAFSDFKENELRSIFSNYVSSMRWITEPYLYRRSEADNEGPMIIVDVSTAAARRLSRGANRKGFANARSVRVLVEQACRVASQRQIREVAEALKNGHKLGDTHLCTITLPDVLRPPIQLSGSSLIHELRGMIGLREVKKSINGLLHMAVDNYASELRGEGVLDISLHRMFLGNPGTGNDIVSALISS